MTSCAHPVPGLRRGMRTLYALVSDDGRVLTRGGRWGTELREADLRARHREFDSVQRAFGGTVWRVQLFLHAPAIARREVGA